MCLRLAKNRQSLIVLESVKYTMCYDDTIDKKWFVTSIVIVYTFLYYVLIFKF